MHYIKMNLDIESIKQELEALKKELHRPVRFFKIYYEVEYWDKVYLDKILEDMLQANLGLRLAKVYIYCIEQHDKRFDNPIYHIYRHTYKIYFWIVLHTPAQRDSFDTYFKNKIGTVCTESYLRFDEFLKQANTQKKKINYYFEVDLEGNITPQQVPKILNV